jgi:hypothetical protein
MRFARGDMRGTTSFHTKTTTNLRSGTAEPCSGKNVQKSTFAGISGQFDFRLLQHNLAISRRAILFDHAKLSLTAKGNDLLSQGLFQEDTQLAGITSPFKYVCASSQYRGRAES